MLIKITNACHLGCSHCIENSTPAGQHMTEETFLKALGLTRRVERLAYDAGCPPLVFFSGGECTEHPDIVRFLEIAVAQGLRPLLITNGMWLANQELREAILRPEWPRLFIQVTNDPRYYPKAPPRVDDKRITYIDSLTLLTPMGRLARRKTPPELPLRQMPSSFNLRSLTRSFRSIERAIAALRTRALTGLSGHCTPNISDHGGVHAGESRDCFQIGTVDSSNEALTEALIGMNCNRCGLVNNLSQEHKRAIGEATLYLEGERDP